MPLSVRFFSQMGNHMLNLLSENRTEAFRDRVTAMQARPLFTRRELTTLACLSGILSAFIVVVA